jgi:hypothetical protein
VVIGKEIDLKGNTDNALREPPAIPGANDNYDSVKGYTCGSEVFIVYKNVKTYPGLLVRYEL